MYFVLTYELWRVPDIDWYAIIKFYHFLVKMKNVFLHFY